MAWTHTVALTAAVLQVGTASVAGRAHGGSKPHLILILQDDLGHYDVAFNGNANAAAVTANITALAKDGVVLTRHYTHWHCSPTRRSFISGRLPIHHHEQLSSVASDDIDLRYTWISKKLANAGYECHWYGKGHTGYRSMNHLPTRNGFHRFMGFLGGSQSYYSNDRWEDEHPVHNDTELLHPPPDCLGDAAETPSSRFWNAVRSAAGSGTTPCSQQPLFQNQTFVCGNPANHTEATSAADCCAKCALINCSHWTYAPSGYCSAYYGRCQRVASAGSVSGVAYHPDGPSPGPGPPPGPPPPQSCATSYSTDLYGKLAVEAVVTHDPTTPLFLYLPFQAVHTPYQAPPGGAGTVSVYQSMLREADEYVGALVQATKSNGMYANTVYVYSADNGGTGSGINYPLRGEKHTNWEGGLRTAAFISGGLIPPNLRGTSSSVVLHIVDWYATFCFLAGADGTDDPPVAPLPVDPSNPSKDIYGNHSFPSVDGRNAWPALLDPSQSQNTTAVHPYLVLSKEVIVSGNMKLLVGQNYGWSHTADNGWKDANGSGFHNITLKGYACDQTDLPGDLVNGSLPGITGSEPCLFDVEADAREMVDLNADRSPAVTSQVIQLWALLNHTVLTAFCRQPIGSAGCGTSPAELLGPCNSECAGDHWKAAFGTGSDGPVCGVPGCTAVSHGEVHGLNQ